MSQSEDIPTLCEWAGGPEALLRLTRAFYAKVPGDALLAPVFAEMDPRHAEHVAHFLAEVLGGARLYTLEGGSHAGMISRHLNRHLNEAQRQRWIALMLETADEIALPDDPEFRSALVGYLEWGTRLARLNSQNGVPAPDPTLAMPQWNWGATGGPFRA